MAQSFRQKWPRECGGQAHTGQPLDRRQRATYVWTFEFKPSF